VSILTGLVRHTGEAPKSAATGTNRIEEAVKAGILLAAEGLTPTSKGARVKFSGDERTVIDGPFAETKELIAFGARRLHNAIRPDVPREERKRYG
jgi:hypothetical protein